MKNWTGFSISRQRKEAVGWAETLVKVSPLLVDDAKYTASQVLAVTEVWMVAFEAHKEFIRENMHVSIGRKADMAFFSDPMAGVGDEV